MQRLHIILFTFFCLGATFADAQTTYGCNDPDACNYSTGGFTVNSGCKYADDVCDDGDAASFASHYDNSCNCVETIIGCMDATACNYNASATMPHVCIYPFTVDGDAYTDGNGAGCWICSQTIGAAPHGDGKGILIDNDINDNGICDDDEVYGCMNPTACNYHPDATAESAFSEQNGATAPSPCVFAEGCNYCGLETDDGLADSLIYDTTSGSNYATHPDYIVLNGDKDGNGICDVNDIYGCMDENACNFNVNATADTSYFEPVCIAQGECGCDGGSALDIPSGDCDCNGAQVDSLGICLLPSNPNFCSSDANANGICDADEVEGCMNENACNYDSTANIDDDSCDEVDECGVCGGTGIPAGFCDCAGTQADTNGNGLCDASEVQGCTNDESCTYNPDATFHVVSACEFLDECNVCGGSGITDPSHCNCEGDVLDALGKCGGACQADVDGDGICDNVDPCLVPGEQPDECGVCGGPGAIYECGCEPLLDRACSCDPSTGEQFVPDPGKDCDGNCLNGQDENSQCIVSSSEVVTELTSPLMARVEGNKVLKELNPFDMERWLNRVDTLHARMSRNLDDGSLLGKSDSLTIEHQILNKGKLYVQDESVFSDFVRMDSSVTIGGNLLVEGWARIKGTTFSDGGLETTTLDMTGDLNVGGAVYIDSTLSVTRDVNFEEDLTVANSVVIGNDNAVRMTDVGRVEMNDAEIRDSLTVRGESTLQGDVHLGGNLSVHAGKFAADTLGNVAAAGDLSVAGNATTTGTQSVTGTLSTGGKLTVHDHGEVKWNMTVGQHLGVGMNFSAKGYTHLLGPQAGQFTPKHYSLLSGESSETGAYTLWVDGKGNNKNGIIIRVDADKPGNENDFVTFVDGDGLIVGAIEGERPEQVYTNPAYTNMVTSDYGDYSVASDILTLSSVQMIKVTKKVGEEGGKAGASGAPGAGLPDSDVGESVAHGVIAGTDVAVMTTAIGNVAKATKGVALAIAGAAASQVFYFNRIGVAYKSGSADYAEWIEKADTKVKYAPGEIVGVKEGKISYTTADADHLLVISTNPIVLGNQPEEHLEYRYEKVAFMGQVPVRIRGEVSKGDYILPFGEHDGTGIAVSPEDILLEQIPQIIGVAWEDGNNDYYNVVNCSIGLENTGMDALVSQINDRFEALEMRMMDQLDARIVAAGHMGKGQRRDRVRKANRLKKPHRDDVALTLHDNREADEAGKNNTAFASCEELNQQLDESIQAILNDHMDDGLEITRAEWEEGKDELAASMESFRVNLEVLIAAGGDDWTNRFSELFDFGAVPQEVIKADAAITLALFDAFVNVESLTEGLHKELDLYFKEHPEEREAYASVFPQGSQAEKQFIEGIYRDIEQTLYDMFPHTAVYGRGRVK